MKILNRYIIKEHIGPFFFALSVIMFILLMQFMVKHIDKIFGKGLSFLTIFELIIYNLAWMIALAVPMATLVAVLMSFGRFSADNEITILKSSGISIYRIIRPSLFFGLMLTVGMIYFNDQILPDTNHAARKMFQAIKRKKPTLSLQEHIFFELDNFAFVVNKIEKPLPEEWLNLASLLGPEYQNNEQLDRLKNVTIFDKSSPKSTTTINAEEGYMVYSKEKQALIFTLFKGEFHEFDFKKIEEYQRSEFEKHIVYMPAKNFELEASNSSYRSDREMNISQMQEEVLKSSDQANKQIDKVKEDLDSNFKRLNNLFSIIQNDSLELLSKIDTLPAVSDEQHRIARQKAIRTAERYAQKMKTNINLLNNHKSRINKFDVEIYKKLSIPFASIMFVLVGAPLGIMARKGSMGVAITLSLGFFILYWAFLIGGEKLADRRILSPFWAMWSPNAIVFVSGLYLIWRAVRESSFINWDRLLKLFKAKEDL
ncbi:MAG: YjgP/YjgQ family permease [Calditrichaeota bacterium]|nr:MAG: YjgP/YjgQ family permease [Calditrichota bacterium]MBL1207489.1 YjgP/YjgQ family permease [Calditrichota bacterium]NOG47321.1 YjgP/YjgQ family permease [Calditrichota bacterium]